MDKFLIRNVSSNNISSELETIGYDKNYLDTISDKFRYKNIKIYDLTVAQANILKQTALIFGADCAVHRDVVTGQIDKSDVILCGSYSQLKKISEKLKSQPFKLAILGEKILSFISSDKKRQTKLVGILNITDNSFSDGGLYFEPKNAQKKLMELIEDGADLIDIGAESTKPYSKPVDSAEQIKRLSPILDFIQKNKLEIPISVDTRSSEVADFALNNGANIINDVSGFDYDSRMPEIIAKYNAGVIIQHSSIRTEDILKYQNVVNDVFLSLKEKITKAEANGIKNIIIDPGIGFGKDREMSLKLIESIESFYSLNYPVMAGISRKSILGIENETNEIKDAFTLAYSYPLILSGIDYLRVHNVKSHKKLINSIPNRAIYSDRELS